MTFFPKPLQHKTFNVRLWATIIGVILFLFAIFLFSLFQARRLLEGPVITLDQNTEVIEAEGQLVTLSGNAKNIAFMWVNGMQIYTNKDGVFETTLLVPPGSSILEVQAEDKASNEKILRIPVFSSAARQDKTPNPGITKTPKSNLPQSNTN